jgi:hypothetical protein
MQTRNGLTYGEPIHFLQKVEQKQATLDFAEPIPNVNTDQFCTTFSKSCLAPPFSKVELKVDFDEASTAWKLNKKSIGNGCYKYVCVKVKKNGHQCKNDSLKNCEHCKFHSTFKKG